MAVLRLLMVMVCLVALVASAAAQDVYLSGEPAASPRLHAILPSAATTQAAPGRLNAPSWLAPARAVTPTGAGHAEEVAGSLISDPRARHVRFEANGRMMFAVPYEAIVAIHYESFVEEWRSWPFRGTKYFLTIHYADRVGQAAFLAVRMSEPDVRPALDALERDTGLTIDHTLGTRSFLGIPIRAAIGARVAITNQAGQAVKGTISSLSASSLALSEGTSAPRIFEAADVRKIRLVYSPKRDALEGLAVGAAVGALTGALIGVGAGSGCEGECHPGEGAAIGAAILGGLVATIGVTVGAAKYGSNKAYDVYIGTARAAPTRAAFTVVPLVGKERNGVLVTVRF